MEGEVSREEKLLAGKKKFKKLQKKKATSVTAETSPISTRRKSTDSAAASSTRRSSVTSDSGSVKAEVTEGKAQETIKNADESSNVANFSPEASGEVLQDPSSGISQTTHSSLVEGHQPITYSHAQQLQTDILSKPIDIAPTENTALPTGISGDEPVSYESLANICSVQQQTIALLVEEKTALVSDLGKYSVMADRFKSSEEFLEEGRLLVDALRRQNGELEEKIKSSDDRLREAEEQKKKIIESLQSQNARVEQLEKDNKQLLSQLNTKDSIIEQLTAERAKIRTTSEEVEALQKSLQDKEDRCEALEIELSNLRHQFTNAEQELKEKGNKLLITEQDAHEKHSKFESMANQIQSLTEIHNDTNQKLEKKSSEFEVMSREFAELNEQLSMKLSVIDELQRDRDNLTLELQASQSENSKMTKRIKDLTTKIDGLSLDNRNLLSQLTELRGKFVEISNDKSVLVEEVDREKSRANRLEQEIAKIQEQLSLKGYGGTLKTNGTSREVGSKASANYLLNQEHKQDLHQSDSMPHKVISSQHSANHRYAFSEFSSDFEIGKCSGCIGEVIVV
ncbi:14895_t:CDS:2 [Acaulospora morrowiae]|uniref:14895_t:CDS:1 n=1 Tax=Acaulospora morrowiae TaxID=94023 RepID=A0A9N9CDE3_9GLOM|nr:14895_t:CDS:2 [Acaulospora morrowiae]